MAYLEEHLERIAKVNRSNTAICPKCGGPAYLYIQDLSRVFALKNDPRGYRALTFCCDVEWNDEHIQPKKSTD